MKEYLVIVKFQGTGFMVFDYDKQVQAETAVIDFHDQIFEVGNVMNIESGRNLNWTCPVCDGGPGNYCTCKC